MICDKEIKLIVVDDIHSFRDAPTAGEIVAELRRVAQAFGVAILALARTRAARTPLALETLVDYELYEHEADVIGILHRDMLTGLGDEARQSATLAIVLNRHGPTGAIPYQFMPRSALFEEVPRISDEDLPPY